MPNGKLVHHVPPVTGGLGDSSQGGEVPRRTILKGAAAATAFSLADILYPGTAVASRLKGRLGQSRQVASTVNKLTGADPGFAKGIVSQVTPSGVVLSNVLLSRALVFPVGALVWKEYMQPFSIIQVGDVVAARGQPQSDGALMAQSGWTWVNIATRNGTITTLSDSGLTLANPSSQSRVLAFSPYLETVDGATGNALTSGQTGLSVGMTIGAVGLALPDGSLRATRIWVVNATP